MERIKFKLKRRNVNEIIKYTVFVFLLFLMTMAQTSGGIRPFGLGLFVALVFARQNLLILAPTYVAACIHADPSWQSAVIGITPAVIFTAAYFVHHRLNRRLGLTAAGVYTALSQIPYLVFTILGGKYYEGALTVVLTQIFAYVAVLAVYPVLRRSRYNPTTDEKIASLVFTGALALSFYNLGYQNFTFFYLPFGFALLACCAVSAATPLYVGVTAGLACMAAGGGVESLAVCVILSAAAAAFKNTGAVGASAAVCAAQLFTAYYFDNFNQFGYVNTILLVSGALIYLLIPKNYKVALTGPSVGVGYARAGKTVVNKNRQELSVRLYSLAGIFEDIRELLQRGEGLLPDMVPDSRTIARDISAEFCGNCENCNACFTALGGDTSDILTEIVNNAERKGKASIIDMPPFITSRCRRINGLITAVNEKNEKRKSYKADVAESDKGRQMLAVQMGGVAEILDNLGDDFKKQVSFDGPREKRIVDELTYHGIDCKEVLVYGEGGNVNVTALIGENDGDKTVIMTVISQIMKIRLIKTDTQKADDGYISVQYAPAPRYDYVYGEYGRKKEGSATSGDVRCIKRLSPSKVLFAIGDGMGSGNEAQDEGIRAVQTVEGFFEAGFSTNCALALTNRLLSLEKGDGFSALDLMLLDLESGACDFIKLGATFTALKHKEKVDIIEGSALPAGALETVRPTVVREIMMNNDLAVLMSDGVTDVLSAAEIADYLGKCKGINPQALAEDLTVAALNAGASDDITVLAVRLFSR